MREPVHYLSIGVVHRAIRDREMSPVDVVDAVLRRIEIVNRDLNAFALVLADEAREHAAQAASEIAAGRWRGPLHGVPIGIKDFYDTAAVRTTAAFERFKHRVPSTDAVSVARLKAAGAVIVGKMNMHTLGMGTTGLESLFGAVRNPWNAAYIPGGSSSGSAAAVAAGLCFATLDTDAIGSCRLPAACCGVVGFKATYGAISMKGVLEGEPAEDAIVRLSHAGLTTRSITDTVIVFDALAAPDRSVGADRQPTEAQPLRIGVANNFTADTDVTAAFEAAVQRIRAFGHNIVPSTAPFDVPPIGDLRAIDGDRQNVTDRVFRDIDVLLLPTLTTTVPTVEQAGSDPQALSPVHTMFANYFGLPAVSLPCGFDRNGLPIGLQLVGRPWDERTVFELAQQYEATRPLMTRRPLA
jgi:aspartyl-tRNA(Asn)/glutamyl-tRNA(Gln) amidotransferase subunit A